MKVETFMVDSFTNEVFKGNPAGVCILNAALEESTMLSIAKELGLSETAFVSLDKENQWFNIRYFSPKMEIPLCGHATLAASKVLFKKNAHLDKLTYSTVENIKLSVKRAGEEISMTFPRYSTTSAVVPPSLVEALGVSEVVDARYNKETKILLLEISNPEELRLLNPEYNVLINSHVGINGVLVTALSKNPHYDFESRYFWPWSGTLEDPVTGGTHTFLAPHWAGKLNKKVLKSYQCSERTGSMTITILDEHSIIIKGHATLFLEGHCEV